MRYIYSNPGSLLQSHMTNRSKTSGCVCPAVDLSVCVHVGIYVFEQYPYKINLIEHTHSCKCMHLSHSGVLYTEEPVCLCSILLSRSSHLLSATDMRSLLTFGGFSEAAGTVVACSSIHLSCLLFLWRVKMPFHHVKAGLLYTDNFLSTSLSETSEEQLANISTEELGGEWVCVCLCVFCLDGCYLSQCKCL